MVLHRDAFACLPSDCSIYLTKSDRGAAVRRNFCFACGSHIFSQIMDFPEIVTVKAATLDDFGLFVPEYLVWIQSVGASCPLPPGIPSFPKSAPLEMLLGKTPQLFVGMGK